MANYYDYTVEPSTFCEICRSDSTTLLSCLTCNLSIHAECYGILPVETSTWICERCSAPPGMLCKYCSGTKGAMKQIKGEWMHVICLRWLPCLKWDQKRQEVRETMSPSHRNCCYCGLESRFCLQCKHLNCLNSFHPMCALKNGIYPTTNQEFMLFCHEHFNGKLKETIKKIYKNTKPIDYDYIDEGDTLCVNFHFESRANEELKTTGDSKEDDLYIFDSQDDDQEEELYNFQYFTSKDPPEKEMYEVEIVDDLLPKKTKKKKPVKQDKPIKQDKPVKKIKTKTKPIRETKPKRITENGTKREKKNTRKNTKIKRDLISEHPDFGMNEETSFNEIVEDIPKKRGRLASLKNPPTNTIQDEIMKQKPKLGLFKNNKTGVVVGIPSSSDDDLSDPLDDVLEDSENAAQFVNRIESSDSEFEIYYPEGQVPVSYPSKLNKIDLSQTFQKTVNLNSNNQGKSQKIAGNSQRTLRNKSKTANKSTGNIGKSTGNAPRNTGVKSKDDKNMKEDGDFTTKNPPAKKEPPKSRVQQLNSIKSNFKNKKAKIEDLESRNRDIRVFNPSVVSITGIKESGNLIDLERAFKKFLRANSIPDLNSYKITNHDLAGVLKKDEIPYEELASVVFVNSMSID